MNFNTLITEQKRDLAQDIAVGFIFEFVNEHYPISEEIHECNDRDLVVFEELVDYFIENYTHSLMGDSTTNPKNEQLFDDMYEFLLDESIGSAISSAVHGVSGYLAKRQATKAAGNLEKAKTEYDKTKQTANAKGGLWTSIKSGYASSQLRKKGKNVGLAQRDVNIAKERRKDIQLKKSRLTKKINQKAQTIGSRIGQSIGKLNPL